MNKKKILIVSPSFPKSIDDANNPMILGLIQSLNNFDTLLLAPNHYKLSKIKIHSLEKKLSLKIKLFNYPQFGLEFGKGGGLTDDFNKTITHKISILLMLVLFSYNIFFSGIRKYAIISQWSITGVLCIPLSIFFKKIFCHLRSKPSSRIEIILIKLINFFKIKLITTSNYMKDRIYLSSNVKVNNIIPSGISDSKFKILPYKKIIAKNEVNIGFVGRLVKWKGCYQLLQSVINVKLNNLTNKKINLFVVGDGPEKNFLINLNNLNQLNDLKIHFLGELNHSEIQKMLTKLDILVVPTIKDSNGDLEPFGTIIIEGIASGLRVLSTEGGASLEAKKYNLISLLDCDNLIESLTLNLIDFIENFEKFQFKENDRINFLSQYNYKSIADQYSKIII